MKRLQSILSGVLTGAMVLSVTACGSAGASDSNAASASKASGTAAASGTSLAYKGDLSLMHFSTSEESQGNGGSDGFRTMISQWQEAHPDIKLNQTVLSNDDYKKQIATQAAANDLPDVFQLQGSNTKAWVKQGLVMDMTDIIKKSPDYDSYKQEFFTAFIENGKTYAIPILTGGTCSVVVYDKSAWQKAGFDKFPTTWEDVKKASDYFKKNNYKETIAFGNGGQWQINSCFLSTIGDRFTGPDWFKSLIDKKGAKFTDQKFVDALKFTQDTFRSGIFNDDFNAINNEDAREYYISKEAPALICGNWDVSYLQSTLKDKGDDLYNNTEFAVLPQPSGATGDENTQNIGFGFGVAINSKLKDDPEKLKAATDLAYKLVGKDFSTYVGEKYALQGITKASDLDLSKFDPFIQKFYKYSYEDTKACEIYDSYINSAVWDVLNIEAQNMLNGSEKPEEVAEKTQTAYAKNYQ